jgi:hypothetical protein
MGVDEKQLTVGDLVMAKYPKLANDKWNSDRIVEYVKNELGGSGTFENFCTAIEALKPSLVWLAEAPPKPLEFVKHTEKISGAPLTRRSHLDIQTERDEKEKLRKAEKEKYDREHPVNTDPYPTAVYFPGTSRIDHNMTFEARKNWQIREDARQREKAGIGEDGRPTAIYFESGPHVGQVNWRASQDRWAEWDKKHPKTEKPVKKMVRS